MAHLRHSLLLPSLLLASTCMAQVASDIQANMPPGFESVNDPDGVTDSPGNTNNGDRDGGDVVFYEDFANGLAGNNGVGPWTVAGPHGNIWKRKITGPVGAFTNAVQERIGAPATFANGFMVFQSDSANCNWANPNAPVFSSTPTSWDGALVSPVLDLSATPFVKIEWTQRLRYNGTELPHALEVSTDGGANWTASFPAASVLANVGSGTIVTSVSIGSAIAANPANVRFRFQHNPVAWNYHWQIDDVKVIELFSNDLKIDEGFLSHLNNPYEYNKIPQDQLNPTMLVGANVINNGSAAQTNVTLTTTVRDASNNVAFTSTASTPSLAAGASMVLQENKVLPSLAEGVYTATMVASSDQTEELPADNTYLRAFQITNARYGIDGIGNHPPGLQTLAGLGTNTFTSQTDNLKYAVYYKVRQNVTVYGVEAVLATTTNPGGYITVAVHDSATYRGGNVNAFLAESDLLDITAAHVASGAVRQGFRTPLVLTPGEYYASITLNSNAGQNHIVLIDDITVGQPPWASTVFLPGQQLFSNSVALGIRLVLDPITGIEDRGALEGVSIYPNPTNGLVNVRTEFTGTYTIEVLDVMGRAVANVLGNGATTVDLSGQAQGVYTVRVSTANASTVQRIVLN